MPMIDPVTLTQDLIRCPSVTPEEGGALDLLQRVLAGILQLCDLGKERPAASYGDLCTGHDL